MSDVTAVYPYLARRARQDELKYSLRSLWRNLPGVEPVLVGDRPEWYIGKSIDLVEDNRGAYFDTTRKWRAAMLATEVSDTFVWMMDDLYIMQPSSLADFSKGRERFAWVHPAEVKDLNPTSFRDVRLNTMERLKVAGFPYSHDCTIHGPWVMEKTKCIQLWAELNAERFPLTIDLAYANAFMTEWGPTDTGRISVDESKSQSAIRNKARRYRCINHVDIAYTRELEIYLRAHFPSPCPWELTASARESARIKSDIDLLVPCRYRGPHIGDMFSQICGTRGDRRAIHACGKFGRCTDRPYLHAQPEPNCLGCAHAIPPERSSVCNLHAEIQPAISQVAANGD